MIAWSPALIAIVPLMLAAGGGNAVSAATLSMVADQRVQAGAMVPVAAELAMLSPLKPSFGTVVTIDPVIFTFSIEPMRVAGGGFAPFASDVPIYQFEGTAMFPTGLQSTSFYSLRVPNEFQMAAPLSADAGARLLIDGQMTVAYSAFDPVVRPRKVRTQMIVS